MAAVQAKWMRGKQKGPLVGAALFVLKLGL
jgi:hypothetical protein